MSFKVPFSLSKKSLYGKLRAFGILFSTPSITLLNSSLPLTSTICSLSSFKFWPTSSKFRNNFRFSLISKFSVLQTIFKKQFIYCKNKKQLPILTQFHTSYFGSSLVKSPPCWCHKRKPPFRILTLSWPKNFNSCQNNIEIKKKENV